MKKKRNKLLRCLMLTVCLVAVFTVNVLADGWYSYENCYFDGFLYISESSQSKFTYRFSYKKFENNAYAFDLSVTTVGDVVAFARAGSTFQLNSISAGQKVTIHPDGDFSGWFGGTTNKMNGFAWALVKFDNEGAVPFSLLYRSAWYPVEFFDSNEKGTFYRCPRRDVTLTIGRDYDNVFVALLFDVELETGNTFSINRQTYDVSWGDPNSPQAPKYVPPDSGTIDEYTSLEQEILDGSEEGIDQVNGLFSGFDTHLSKVVAGVTGANTLFDIAWSEFTFFTPLVFIALVLGVFGFLVNISFGLTRSFDSDAKYPGWQKGANRQDSKFIKPDGIASHRPSRK